jgi:hypothetical protein
VALAPCLLLGTCLASLSFIFLLLSVIAWWPGDATWPWFWWCFLVFLTVGGFRGSCFGPARTRVARQHLAQQPFQHVVLAVGLRSKLFSQKSSLHLLLLCTVTLQLLGNTVRTIQCLWQFVFNDRIAQVLMRTGRHRPRCTNDELSYTIERTPAILPRL